MMPPGVGTPTEGPFATGLGEILEFELHGPGYTPMQLYQILQVADRAAAAPGAGHHRRSTSMAVTCRPTRCRSRRSGCGRRASALPEVFAAIQANNDGAWRRLYRTHQRRAGDRARPGAGAGHADGHRQHRAEDGTARAACRSRSPTWPTVKLAPKVRLGAVTHDGEGETILGVADMQYGLNASDRAGAAAGPKIAEVQEDAAAG